MRRTRRGVLAAFGTAAVGGLAGLGGPEGAARAAPGSWPQPGADAANTGYVAERGPSEGTELWRHEGRGPGAAPLVAAGLVFPPGGAGALDAATGERRWRGRTTSTSATGTGRDGRVIGYDSVTAVADGVAIVRDRGTLYGLSTGDGSRQWAHALPGPNAAVSVAEGTAYVWTGNRTQSVLIALRANDGTFRWRYRTSPGSGVPAVADGRLYLNLGDRIAALDAGTGEEQWRYEFHSAPGTEAERADADRDYGFASSPVVTDGRVHVADSAGRLHTLATADGREVWRFTPAERPPAGPGESAAASRPAVADDTVYAGFSDGRVRAFDAATGEERWSFRAWNGITGSPAVTEETVYVGGYDTMVYALDRETGRRRWEFSVDWFVHGVSVAGGRAYASTRGGTVHALGDGGDA